MQVTRTVLISAVLGDNPNPPSVTRQEDESPPRPAPTGPDEPRPERPTEKPLDLPEIPQRSLSIRVEEDKAIVYRIIDEQTGEVVRQIPPEEVRRAARRITELIRTSEAKHPREVDLQA